MISGGLHEATRSRSFDFCLEPESPGGLCAEGRPGFATLDVFGGALDQRYTGGPGRRVLVAGDRTKHGRHIPLDEGWRRSLLRILGDRNVEARNDSGAGQLYEPAYLSRQKENRPRRGVSTRGRLCELCCSSGSFYLRSRGAMPKVTETERLRDDIKVG